ncbi:MAG: CPBP family intramembrane glutamic endopeptidase [Gemmatimonadaceae bacterium]
MENNVRRWAVSGRVLLFLISCAVLLASIAPLERRFPGLPPGLFTGAVASLGTLLLTVVFVRWEGLRLEDVGAAVSRKSPLRFVIGFLVGLILVALHVSVEGIAGHIRWVRSEGLDSIAIATSLIVYVLLACREELAFHGYPLRRLNKLFGLWVSQLTIALVFAAEHVAGGMTWGQALLGAGVGSLLFGMASIATKGLAVPIGLHAAWNFGDWMHGGKNSGGVWHPVVVAAYRDLADRAAMIGYVVVMLSATLAFWWLHRRIQNRRWPYTMLTSPV